MTNKKQLKNKCPECGYKSNDKEEFMKGSIDGAFTCPAGCGYSTDDSSKFGLKI